MNVITHFWVTALPERSNDHLFFIKSPIILSIDLGTIGGTRVDIQCSKYIKKGNYVPQNLPDQCVSDSHSGSVLTQEIKNIIAAADTFFVSSFNPDGHADACHRGGTPGFIKITNDQELIIPDFRGNSMYNPLGNFKLNPEGGIVFYDQKQSSLLHLRGQVTLDIMAPEKRPRNYLITGETGRFWHFNILEWELTQSNYSLIFES